LPGVRRWLHPRSNCERRQHLVTGLQVPGQGAWTLTVWLEDAAGNVNPTNSASVQLHYLDGAGGGPRASAELTLARPKARSPPPPCRTRTAADDLTNKIAIRYRYRPHKHSKLRTITKTASVHHGAFVAHLKVSHATRRTGKASLAVSYSGDTIHDAAKISQRVKLLGR
jgi:hypothetical protein